MHFGRIYPLILLLCAATIISAQTPTQTNLPATASVTGQIKIEEQLFVLQPEDDKSNSSRQNARRMIRDNSLVSPERTGAMNFRNLNVGRYRLSAKLLDDNWYVRSITLPGALVKATTKAPSKPTTTDVTRNGLNLKSGDKITGLLVKVAEGAAAIKGQIKADDPLPPILRVYLVPVEKERAADVLRYGFTGISTDGAFTFGHLAPGKYPY